MELLLAIFAIFTIANAAILKPGSSGQLQQMLDSANPGDIIQMGNMVYEGDFTINKNGPITLQGDANSTIKSDGDAGLHVKGNEWKMKGFWIKGPSTGLLISGNKNEVQGLIMEKTGKAIVIKGEENTVKSCVISEADTGILMEGSKNKLYYNSVNIQTPGIIILESACCGLLDGNVCNGEMNVNGDNWMLKGNVINHGLYVKGCNNKFMGNVANHATFPASCSYTDLGGNSYRGLGPGDTDPPQQQQQQPQQTQGQQFASGSNNGFGQNQNQNPSGQINNHFGQPSQTQTTAKNVPTQVLSNNGGQTPKCTCTCE